MASKGPRSKLDHESRARRQKALEAPKERRRPKTHWDHVLKEMAWLSKDFESERKWKLAQAKKVAIRATKGMVDQATKGERRVKEEEQRLRKVALNISKDVKKFWMKIEKLVLYEHQLELDEKKKKVLDKQLEFLLGQTERYSTMLAENLVNTPIPCKTIKSTSEDLRLQDDKRNGDEDSRHTEYPGSQSNALDADGDYDIQSEDELEDDEHTIEEDEAFITREERDEELSALQNEVDLPLSELLKRYGIKEANRDGSWEKSAEVPADCKEMGARECNGKCKDSDMVPTISRRSSLVPLGLNNIDSNGFLPTAENHVSQLEVTGGKSRIKRSLEIDKRCLEDDFNIEQDDDDDFVLSPGGDKEHNMDDETTLLEEEALAKAESNDAADEIELLQKESEIPIEELLLQYKKVSGKSEDVSESSCSRYDSVSEDFSDTSELKESESKQLVVRMKDDDEATVSQLGNFSHREDNEAEHDEKSGGERESESIIADAAAAARSAQPTGNTFLTTKVRTKFPFLLKYPLREYQHIGLDWLVTMYEKKLNGILADEMGLGKTIMTIALLSHLACEKGIWGPHLIVVPTSVMLNWETEFLRWSPAFKILTYFGSAKERKIKRQGWLKPNAFHVCITTYRLVIQDAKVFKRKKWKYLILDEAHLIKNWKSQRWQTLLNFNSKRRILLTGTPLQNDLMELWSLMHFLMPHIFQSHQEFKDWFCNPISGMVEGQEMVNKEVVDRLHNVLRPFILRRLKRDVEKQLPMKVEHVVNCRLSRRQRNLYEDFIASSETQTTLASSNFFGMISVIMQLRKVCNHPDLFEGRPIVSSFDMNGIDIQLSSAVCSMLVLDPFSKVDLDEFGFLFTHLDFRMTSWESDEVQAIDTPSNLIKNRAFSVYVEEVGPGVKQRSMLRGTNIFEEIQRALREERLKEAKERAASIAWWNSLRCKRRPIYSTGLRERVIVKHPVYDIHHLKSNPSSYLDSSKLAELVLSPVERFEKMLGQVECFVFAIPAARAAPPLCWCSKTSTSAFFKRTYKKRCCKVLSPLLTPFRPAIVRRQVYFPDRRLIQFDCGKLQELSVLLRRLKFEGHRALIFTQMTKMLDILEAFINIYGYTYMRLDGSTLPEDRQMLMQRFNTNPKYFLFILSTRSGGVGINLVGADTVIFYDSDWNPAMDQQAQDRCHRIGQTREVHIYRLISESTIEENILRKANQKRALDDLVIQSGSYNTEFFKKLDPLELFSVNGTAKSTQNEKPQDSGTEVPPSNADVEAALKNAEDEADYMALKRVEQEEAVDNQEFTEETIGKLEDDELGNEEDMRINCLDEKMTDDNKTLLNISDPADDRAPIICDKEDDVNMLADVKQMAEAAAAAGHAVLSFENQLRPIDRYAVRFLELWDPIIDKNAIESQVEFEEREWELDRLEKLKEDMEAENDEDEEPLVYESWDAEFATEVYRQQVEALAQHQLEEELEREAREKEISELNNIESMRKQKYVISRPKSKKKAKKKFKSLKKGPLASEAKALRDDSPIEGITTDYDISDYDDTDDLDVVYPVSTSQKKRRSSTDRDQERSSKKSKKMKGPGISSILNSQVIHKHHDELRDSKYIENHTSIGFKPVNRSKMGTKVSITSVPGKRVFAIKLEKLKRKGTFWSKDYIPSPDCWMTHEDACLCAFVHEYGPNWSLISDLFYGVTGGGYYRGRFRHPVHCCERFRGLIQKHVFSPAETVANDKACTAAFGKGLLRVTEDNLRTLLDVVSTLPDNEPLLQRHFFALISTVCKASSSHGQKSMLSHLAGDLYLSGKQLSPKVNGSYQSFMNPLKRIHFSTSPYSGKLVAAALLNEHDVELDKNLNNVNQKVTSPVSERLDITLNVHGEHSDSATPLPSVINVTIYGADLPSPDTSAVMNNSFKACRANAEKQFRALSEACLEDSSGCATLPQPGEDKFRSLSKSMSLRKHKLPLDPATPSKSKLRKTADPSGIRGLASDTASQSNVSPSDGSLLLLDRVDFPEIEVYDLFSGYPFDINDGLAYGTNLVDIAPLEYVHGLISGLDDCTLSDIDDIG
ncbi:hypothetical protein LIER_04807 [Lithospermum erythrorhizon]|uniref:DNA helicase n=1 Tax=Lithospermum erythrorhizon TaxID=34254 RepID=A0AAV3NY25_LITER